MKLNILKIQDRLTQMERHPAWLAGKIGVTRTAVSLWLQGENMPRYHHLNKMASVLELDWQSLILED